MKKIMMCVLLVAGLGTSAMAQSENKGRGEFKKLTLEQRVDKQTERTSQSLQLTDAQKQSLYNANLESAQAFKKVNDERRARMKAIRQAKEEKLKSILTAEQFQKHQQMKAERRKKMQERKAAGKGRGHMRGGKGNLRKTMATPQGQETNPVK